MDASKVFLGGTTAGPDYRQQLIPLLNAKYFNPVVADWNEEARAAEVLEKDNCGIALYVLTPYLSGVFSVAEVVEDSITRRPKRTILCVLDGFAGKSFEPHVARSIKALSELVAKYGTPTVTNLTDCGKAVNYLAYMVKPGDQYLFFNKWLSLKKLMGPTGEYVYSHEERCDGNIVVVLPFRTAENKGSEVLARMEYTPCWNADELNLSSITGGVDKGEDAATAAVRELYEETGYQVQLEDMVSLGTSYGVKSSDTIYHLFAVNVSDIEGSGNDEVAKDKNEKKSYNTWITNLEGVVDPLLYTVHTRWLALPQDTDAIEAFRW